MPKIARKKKKEDFLELPDPSEKLDAMKAAILASTAAWFESFGAIQAKGGSLLQFPDLHANWLQRKISDCITFCEVQKRPCRILLLKPRQKGCSTFSMAAFYRFLAKKRRRGGVIGGSHTQGSNLFKMLRCYADNDGFAGDQKARVLEEKATFPNGSTAMQETASNPNAGRSGTYECLVACVPGDTQVLGVNGAATRIDQVKVGDLMLTHQGNLAPVKAITRMPNAKGDLYKITPKIGKAVSFTYDHPLWTKRGWVPASELKDDDFLSMPIRQFTHVYKSIFLPDNAPRPQGGGRKRDFANVEMPLNYEFGFFIGMYLAEGCLCFSEKRYPSRITLAHDKDSPQYVAKAISFVRHVLTSVEEFSNKRSRTVQQQLQCAALATWVNAEFGSAKCGGKRIPEWVFDAGEDFCRGLAIGIFSGDGSKKGGWSPTGATTDAVNLKSIYPSIIPQVRDMIAAFGWGWAGIQSLPAGEHYGRNCKECWMANWSGDSGRKIREAVGLPLLHEPIREDRAKRWHFENGKVWIKIKSIKREPCEEVWDLSMEHDDHSFRTSGFSCKNTEVARWAEEGVSNAADVLAGILKCIPMLAGTLAILETTAAGAFGDFYDRWQRGITFEEFRAGKDGWVKIFAPWFVFEDSIRDPKLENISSVADYSEKESELARQHDLSPEQVAWMRWAIREECKNDFDTFCQDYPFDDVSAFLTSGRKVFNVQGLKKMKDESELPQNQPEYGILEISDDETKASFRPTDPNDAQWVIWERPRPGCEYILSVDLMTGATQTGSKNPDNHSAQVWRKGYFQKNKGWVPHRLVAHLIGDWPEWEKNKKIILIWDIDVLEERVYRGSLWYGNCMIAPEINMDRGIIELLKQRGANIYQREIFNRREFTEDKALGWLTDHKTREMIVEKLKTGIREHGRSFEGIDIHSPMVLSELESMIIKQNGRSEAKSGKHDDSVMAAGISVVLMERATMYRITERERPLPPDLEEYLSRQIDNGTANQYS